MKEKIKKHSIAIIICFVFALVCFFSVSGFNLANLKYSGDSITSDEVPHITSGYYYLKSGRYFLNPEHPPLVKDISALLTRFILNPLFPQVSTDTLYTNKEQEKEDLFFNKNVFPRDLEIENYHWDNRMFIFNPKNNPDLIILLSRLSVIIFNSIFLFILYLLLKKSWNKRSALISIFLIAVSQFSIAHASLVTTDFMASILSISALVVFSIYLKNRSEENNDIWFFLSVLFFALAFISKFSALLLIPAAFLGGLVYCVFVNIDWKEILAYTKRFTVIIILSMLLVFSFYSFHVINSDTDGIKSQLQKNYPSKFPSYGKEFLMKMSEGNKFGKAVATYGVGLSMTINRIDSAGQATYFMGKIYGSEGAGRWYFPILYLTKLSPSFHLLTLFSLILFLRLLTKHRQIKEMRFKFSILSFFIFVFLIIYAYKSISSNLNIGLRHFMPVIFASVVLTARGLDIFWDEKVYNKVKVSHFSAVLLTIMIISTIISFPSYLSYYNIIAGGTDNGYKIATDSNYDWGQDIKRLGKWVRDNNVEKIYTHLFSANKLDYYLNNKYQSYNIEYDDLPSSGSYLAVSAQELQNNIYNLALPEDKKYSQLKNDLVVRVGKSIFVFKIP